MIQQLPRRKPSGRISRRWLTRNRGVRALRGSNGSRSRCRRSTDSTPRSTAMAAAQTTSAASTARTARSRFRLRSNGACNSTAALEVSTAPARPAAPGTCSGAIPPSGSWASTAPIRIGMESAKLSIGHVYTIGRNALTLGSEYGFALGGGRMAALFAQGVIAGGGKNAVLGGLRVYFGQHDKTLIERNRQDDPDHDGALDAAAFQFLEAAYQTQTEIFPVVTAGGQVLPPGTPTPIGATQPATTPSTTTGGGTSTCTLGPPVCPL